MKKRFIGFLVILAIFSSIEIYAPQQEQLKFKTMFDVKLPPCPYSEFETVFYKNKPQLRCTYKAHELMHIQQQQKQNNNTDNKEAVQPNEPEYHNYDF